MNLENKIITHYADKDPAEIKAGADHMHIGGDKATGYVLSKMNLNADMRVLDIGCGVGGPALYVAEHYGCFVTGIDLTPAFINEARDRTALGPHRDKLYFELANAEKLDFKDETFDAAYMLHTGMNIADKKTVYAEIFRVLKQGTQFSIYDILALENVEDMTYPCPWAKTQDTSFLENYETIKSKLESSGFEIILHENCRDYAQSAMQKMLDMMGNKLSPARREVITDLHTNIKKGACAPFIIICKKP